MWLSFKAFIYQSLGWLPVLKHGTMILMWVFWINLQFFISHVCSGFLHTPTARVWKFAVELRTLWQVTVGSEGESHAWQWKGYCTGRRTSEARWWFLISAGATDVVMCQCLSHRSWIPDEYCSRHNWNKPFPSSFWFLKNEGSHCQALACIRSASSVIVTAMIMVSFPKADKVEN